MFAKQIVWSASLVCVLVASAVSARADPAPAQPATTEARPLTGTFLLAAGYGPDDGLLVRARISQSRLFGTGNALSLDASLSERRQLFAVRYATPELGDGLRLNAELFSERRQMPGFVRLANGGGVTLSRRVSQHLQVFAGYKLEYVSMEGATVLARGDAGNSPAALLTPARIASLRAGFAYDSLDRHDAPLRGTSAGVVFESADRRIGSDYSFDTVHAWVSHHQPIGPMTLHLSASYTQLSGDVPMTERLFLDGSSDIRGYRPGEIGPIDALGRPIGGTSKLTGRAEVEVPLIRRVGLSAVAFMDAGAIGDSSQVDAAHSVGFGLLWRSPIGPLRFEWALPLDRTGPPRFLFSVGGSW
jgi:outer membrane protein insertion porin family